MNTLRLCPLFSLCPLFILLAAGSVLAEEKVEIKLNWKAGRDYLATIESNQAITTGPAAVERERSKMVMGFTAKSGKTPGSKALFIGFGAMTVTKTKDGRDLPPERNEDMKPVEFEVFVDADGAMTGAAAAETLKTADPKFAAIFTAEHMKSLFGQASLYALPKKPVGKGDTWTFQMNLPFPGADAAMAGVYTHAGEADVDGDRCVAIKMKSTLTSLGAGGKDGKVASPEEAALRKFFEETGLTFKQVEVTGTVYYDPESKMVVKTVTESTIAITAKDPDTGKTVSISFKSANTVTVGMIAEEKN